jgi:hypothetical protein
MLISSVVHFNHESRTKIGYTTVIHPAHFALFSLFPFFASSSRLGQVLFFAHNKIVISWFRLNFSSFPVVYSVLVLTLVPSYILVRVNFPAAFTFQYPAIGNNYISSPKVLLNLVGSQSQ